MDASFILRAHAVSKMQRQSNLVFSRGIVLMVRLKLLLLALFFVLTLTYPGAHAQAGKKSAGHGRDQLKMVVVLSRHGVRPPTWTLARLNKYSSLPWPEWSVPPGDLTKHGFELMKRFGAFDRSSLAAAGLLPPEGCSAAGDTYIWADTDERTRESGRALADGLFSGCNAPVLGLPEGENDPVFHSRGDGHEAASADEIFAQFSQRVAALPASSYAALLTEMNRILQGCAPDADCTPQRAPETGLMDTPQTVVRGKGDHAVAIQGPLPLASSFSEDLLLEYTEGMPMESVGWGKVDEAEIVRLLKLHGVYTDLMHRTPLLARMEALGMLNRIARTLEQELTARRLTGLSEIQANKLGLLVGHDTNIEALAGLLGLHWDLDGRKDDTPPGTELAFELWQTSKRPISGSRHDCYADSAPDARGAGTVIDQSAGKADRFISRLRRQGQAGAIGRSFAS